MSFVQVITFILRAFFRGRVALVLESLLLCQQLAVLRVPFVGGRRHLPVVYTPMRGQAPFLAGPHSSENPSVPAHRAPVTPAALKLP